MTTLGLPHENPPSLMEVLRAIFISFKEGSPPSGVATVPSDFDGRELSRNFGGKRWFEVDANVIARHKDDQLQFRLEALLYYLPIYMIQSILEPELTDVAMSSTCHVLSPEVLARVYGGQAFLDCLTVITSEQRRAVGLFLRYSMAFDTSIQPEHAVQKFWHVVDYVCELCVVSFKPTQHRYLLGSSLRVHMCT